MKRLMFSRGVSICGATFCALLLLTGLSTSASAVQINATSYDMLNGGSSSVTFHDDSYSGSGSKTTDYAPLSGGLGDLTDGVVPTQNWNLQPGPLVGWQIANPAITFHFGSTVNIDDVKINMNYGYRSDPVDFLMGGVFKSDPVSNVNPGTANAWYDFPNLGLTGDTLLVTLHYNPTPANWILISEVDFYSSQPPATGVPEPATMLLLGSGLIGLVGYGRKKFFKK